MSLKEGLTQKLGPLPLWAWGAAGVAGMLVLSRLRGGSATGSRPIILSPGSTVLPETNVGGLGSLLGGLTDFICGLPNSPNTFELTLPDGTQIGFDNGIPTAGTVQTVTETGATAVTPVSSTWNPCRPQPPSGGGNGGGVGNPPVVIGDPPGPHVGGPLTSAERWAWLWAMPPWGNQFPRPDTMRPIVDNGQMEVFPTITIDRQALEGVGAAGHSIESAGLLR